MLHNMLVVECFQLLLKEILEKYLDMFVADTDEEIKKLEPIWEEYSCSLLCNEWT